MNKERDFTIQVMIFIENNSYNDVKLEEMVKGVADHIIRADVGNTNPNSFMNNVYAIITLVLREELSAHHLLCPSEELHPIKKYTGVTY